MATQREALKEQSGWLPRSPLPLNVQTGWNAGASSAEAKPAGTGAKHAREQTPKPHYLTTSGLFEGPPRPPAWMEEIFESVPEPEPSNLVNDFRSALRQPQSSEEVPARKTRKGILALAMVGILLASTAAAAYLYRPGKSVAQLQTAKAWMAKQWKSNLQEILSVFHTQAAEPNMRESNRRQRLSPLLREPQSADSGITAAPPRLWETRSSENAASLVLYVTDPRGRRWALTPTGHELGPVNHLNKLPASKAGARLTRQKDCRSLFYPGCP